MKSLEHSQAGVVAHSLFKTRSYRHFARDGRIGFTGMRAPSSSNISRFNAVQAQAANDCAERTARLESR